MRHQVVAEQSPHGVDPECAPDVDGRRVDRRTNRVRRGVEVRAGLALTWSIQLSPGLTPNLHTVLEHDASPRCLGYPARG